jgi:two-component system sensor histidine kinase/response regulator
MLFNLHKYDSYILDEITEFNIKKIFYLSLIALPIHILHIIIFLYTKESDLKNVISWREGIITAHEVALIGSIIFISVSFLIKNKKSFSSFIAKSFPYIVCVFYLVFATFIVSIDQLVTTAITPFLVICILLSVVLLVRPLFSGIFFISGYVLFYNLIALNQYNHDILLSNRANGLTSVGIGFLLSFVLWKDFVKNLEQKRVIENQKKELVLANETKDKFFSIIAHDLRGPIGSLVNMFELLEDETLFTEKERKEAEIAMKKSTKSTYDLLENLLRWSRLQNGTIEFNPENINCFDLVEQCFNLLKNLSKNKKISLVNNIKNDLYAYADKEMITTVIRNLISNAIKFTNENGTIEVNADKKDYFIFISVKDNGVGISNKNIDKLFTISEKITSTGTSGEQGTGLGLVLCKEFIEKNNGKIWVQSEINNGSTFTFTIPVKKS